MMYKLNVRKTYFVVLNLVFLSSMIFARTRIKTVEWNFGGRYSTTDLTSGSVYTFPTRTITLPENNKVIRSAYLEFEGLACSAANITSLTIRFDAGNVANTIVLNTSQITAQTGESVKLYVRADVTSIVASTFTTSGISRNFTASVTITGPTSNSHTLKLYITYEYDDTSPLQVKTVRFPLYSAENIASSVSGQAAPGTYLYSFHPYLPEQNINIQQQWFEVRGLRLSNSTVGNDTILRVGIQGASSVEPEMCFDNSLIDTYNFLYISSSSVVAGFSYTTSPTDVRIATITVRLGSGGSQNPHMYLTGGECVITYIYSHTSSQQRLKTIRYFVGQSTTTFGNFSVPVYFEEDNIEIIRVYAEIRGSYNSTTAGTMQVSYKIGDSPQTTRNYTLQVLNYQISGFVYYLDLTEYKNYLVNGSTVTISWPSLANLGGCGVELIITYRYENDERFTDFYQIFVGQDISMTTENNWTPAHSFSLYFPDPETPVGVRKNFSYYLLMNCMITGGGLGTINANSITTQRVNYSNIISSESVQHMHTTEGYSGSVLFGINTQELIFSASSQYLQTAAGNRTERFVTSDLCRITYSYFPAIIPSTPTALKQYKKDETTQIPVGGWTNEDSVVLTFLMSSSQTATLYPVVELKLKGQPFDGTNLSTGTGISYSGDVLVGSVTISGLQNGKGYRWRARVASDYGVSSWVDFGDNLEDDADFSVDLSSPIVSLVSPLDNFATNSTTITFQYQAVDYPTDYNSGIKNYTLEISTDTGFIPIYFSSTTNLQSVVFNLQSEGIYFWRVKAEDNAGNVSTYTLHFTLIIDTSPPQKPSLILPQNDLRTNTTTIQFQWSTTEDLGPSGVSHYLLEISTDENFTSTYLSSQTVSTSTVFNLQNENIYFWRVFVFDKAGNYSVSVSSKITVDKTPPKIVKNQDYLGWYKENPGVIFDIDFFDEEYFASGLASATFRVYSSTTPQGFPSGLELVSATTIFYFNFPSKTTYFVDNFGFNDLVWSSLQLGYNFFFISCYDLAGNFANNDNVYVFYVKKDIQAPQIINYETQTQWENKERLYNVDFQDLHSGLKISSFVVYSQTNRSGAQLVPWTEIFNFQTPQEFYDTDFSIDFSLLKPGTNYVSIYCIDQLGNEEIYNDVFRILKDTIPPNNITDLVSTQGSSGGTILLQFTAPSDDTICDPQNIRLKNYLIKYKTEPFLDKEDFILTGTTFYISGKPLSAGSQENIIVSDLIEGLTYWIGVLPEDKAGNYSINIATTSNWAKRVAPSKINTLTASINDNLGPGEVQLDWFAVGDDGDEGIASGYEIRYATYQFTENDWDSLDIYPQAITPQPPGSQETVVLQMPQPDTTYYFAIKVYDDAQPEPNYSLMSNIAFCKSQSFGATDGMLVYAQGTLAYPRYYFTKGAGASWQGPFSASTAAATIYWTVLRACPVIRNEKLLATISSNGAIYFQRYNGTTGLWSTPELLTTIASANAAYRCVDIAYEQNSKRAIVVFSSGSLTGQVWYRIWSSTAQAWVSSPTQLNFGGVITGFVRWVRLEPQPNSNGIMLVVLDSNNDICANYWDGTSWTGNTLLTANAYTSTYQCYDVAFVQTTGRCMVLFSDINSTYDHYYRIYTPGSGWSSNATGPGITTTGINWVKLASELNSNRIAMTWLDADSDWIAAVWNGSSWVNSQELSTNMDANTTRLVDIAWEKDTGRCLVVGAVSANPARYPTYRTWTSATGWSAAAQDTGYDLGNNADLRWLQLIPDYHTNRIILLGSNAGGAGAVSLRTRNWVNGWSGGTALTTAGSINSREFFMLAFDRHETISPTYVNYQIGDDIWRSSNSGVYNVDFFDVGSSMLWKVQIQLATSPNNVGIYRSWSDEIENINADEYTQDWKLKDTTWESLVSGKSYISLRIFDYAGNISTATDVFYILKDTQPPVVVNNILGGITTWYNVNPTNIIDVDFYDQAGLSLLTTAYFIVYSSPNFSGTKIVDWTKIFDLNTQPFGYKFSYTTDWSLSEIIWNLLPCGTNYFSLLVYDLAGNSKTEIDTFKILKDTTAPQRISDLSASEGPFYGMVELKFTKPQDTFSGTDLYLVKYATYQITESNFDIVKDSTIFKSTVYDGEQETIIITGLDVDTTYYFAIKSHDRSLPLINWSVMSSTSSSKPQKANIWINEIYAYGSSGNDWIELYNNLQSTISLNGFKILYNGTTVWTGGVAAEIYPDSYVVISGLNLNNNISGEIVLISSRNYIVDKVIYPSHNKDVSFARIKDAEKYFEFDPTPTTGLKNYIQENVKINEIDYASNEEFIEIYNISNDTKTLENWYLRNNSGNNFKFTRKIYPYNFTGIDFSSVDNDNNTYQNIFGLQGLNSNSDFVVLENSLGQVVDRVVWGGVNIFYDAKGSLVSYPKSTSSGVSSPKTIGRVDDGVDTQNNSVDFKIYDTASYGRKNKTPKLPQNIIPYPQENTILPRRFKIELTLSTDCSKGYNNNLWFIRTSGSLDKYSPHIYRLKDLGFDLSSLSQQTTIYIGVVDMIDIDGYKLSTGTVYRIVLNTENDVDVSSQVIINNVLYDETIHTIEISTINYAYANEEKYYPLMKIKLKNQSPYQNSKIALNKIFVKFTDGNGGSLDTSRAKNLFDEICLFKDIDADGKFFVSFDTVTIVKIEKEDFNLINGKQEVVINNIEEVLSQNFTTYYLVVKISSYATETSHKDFKVEIKEGEDTRWLEVISLVEQPYIVGASVITSSPTIVRPLKPPKGTSWPYDLGKKVTINNQFIFNNQVFVFCEDGLVLALSSSGVLSKTFQANSSAISPIISSYFTGEDGYVYFGTKSGSIYKNLISDISQNVWVRNLSDKLSSEVVGYYYESPAKIYAGTVDGYVYKISTGSLDFWTPPLQVYGAVVKSPAIDEGYTEQKSSHTGVSSLWWGTNTGYVYRLGLQDGYILASTQAASSITTSIEYDAGFDNFSLNTLNIYFGSEDGKLYCRYGLNLSSVPIGWQDVNLGSKINSLSLSDDKKLYVGCDKGVYKINARTGAIEWFFATEGAVVSYLDIWRNPGYIYFNTENGFLYCIDTDGKIKNNYPIILDAKSAGSFYYENKKLIIGTDDGKIYMFEE